MTIRRVCLIACTTVAATLCATAQQAKPVRILNIGAISPAGQMVDRPLLISYSGGINRHRPIYVRVFRGTLHDLTTVLPEAEAGRECVTYPSSQTYPASPADMSDANNRQLRLDGLLEFFNQQHSKKQTFTLVFEDGVNNTSNGQLSMKRDYVTTYFSHAVEWTLTASQNVQDAWSSGPTTAPNQGGSLLASLLGFFKVTPVLAAEAATPKMATTLTATMPIVIPPVVHACQIVVQYPPTQLKENAQGELPTTEDAEIFAERQTGSCGN
jgi:hypothetical protein